MTSRTTRLRGRIAQPDILVMPGVHDALSARIAERAGAEAVFLGGYMATASLLAEPDSSQLSGREMALHLERVCDAVSVPVLADADTGYGNLTNVARTVRDFERAGAAGLFIEDQVFPKRCGHTPGKDVVPLAEMLGKIASAVDARHDRDFIIMGRTDAIAVHGFDDALERACRFVEAGCDMVFVEAPRSTDEMARICRTVPAPCMANVVASGLSPALTAAQYQALGYRLAVWPVAAATAMVHALDRSYQALLAQGTTASVASITFEELNELVGLPALRSREARLQQAAVALLASPPKKS